MIDYSKVKKQEKEKIDQFLYLGRWVDKKHFRAFVYGLNDEEKLAKSYEDFQKLIASGIWFASKPLKDKRRKKKHGDSNS